MARKPYYLKHDPLETELMALLMPKTRPLGTRAYSNLGERGLGEIEEDSFIALQAKGDTADSCPIKLCVPLRLAKQ